MRLSLQPLNVTAVQFISASEGLQATDHALIYESAYCLEEPFNDGYCFVFFLLHCFCF